MKPRLVVVFVVTTIAFSSLAISQTPDSLLPGLSWVMGSWDSSAAARSIVQTNTPSFIIGWNWVAPYSPIGRMTHGTFFHINDALDRTGNQLSGLQRTIRDSYVSGTRLIPCINGVSADVNIDGHPVAAQLGNPGAAIGIEYAPWLDYTTTANDVVLLPADSSRAIAGFQTRTMGTRVGVGTRTDPYRLRLVRSSQNHTTPSLALDRPTLDTVMMWKAEDRSIGGYMAPQIQTVGTSQVPTNYDVGSTRSMNTEIMRVSVTLRRTEVNPTGSSDSDVVLSIRLPYALGTVTDIEYGSISRTQLPSPGQRQTYINFSMLPPNVLPPFFTSPTQRYANGDTVPTGRISNTAIAGIPSGQNAQNNEFRIRKGMLPPLGDTLNGEVTIYAEFRCDWNTANNDQSNNINNRRFPARYRHPTSNEIGRLGLEVSYNEDQTTGLGIEIRSIRIETPHMTNVLFGQHNERIRSNVNRFVRGVDQELNRAVASYTPPIGVDTTHPITIWRFYGYDEPAVVHWLAFRRINAMLGGTLITEVNAEDHTKQMHLMGQTTFWQGSGFNTSANIASYAYNLGWKRWNQSIRLAQRAGETASAYDQRLRFFEMNWTESYAGLKMGILNLRFPEPPTQNGAFVFDTAHTNAWFEDDPDTYLERRSHWRAPRRLPIQTSDPVKWAEESGDTSTPDRQLSFLEHRYLDEYVDGTGGILASLEGRMRVSYRDQSSMLWGTDLARPGQYIPWIANIWPQYYLQTVAGGHTSPGADSVAPTNHYAVFANNRPKTSTEIRLSFWMPLVLGAKGMMIYKGIVSTEQGLGALPSNVQNLARTDASGEIVKRNLELGLSVVGAGTLNPQVSPILQPPYANRTDQEIMTSDSICPEWITANDPFNAALYLSDRNDAGFPNTLTMSGLQETVDSLDGIGPRASTIPARIYSGGFALRDICREVTDRVTAMDSLIGRSRDTVGDHILTRLRLRAWYGKGFSTIDCQHPNNTPVQRFSHFFDTTTIATRLKTRHVRRFGDRVSHSDIPGHFDYDAPDSVFADITLHAIVGKPMDSVFALGVLNRRTDPRLPLPRTSFNVDTLPNNHSNWEFVSHDAYLSEVASNPDLAYAQRGARQITIPFNYKSTSGGYKLLRLQEMGGGIDTIIGQDRELAVDFLPGEGKMFRVTVLEGEKPADMQGWLAHNTQRKVVVYPTLAKVSVSGLGAGGGTSLDVTQRAIYDTTWVQDPICSRMDTLQPQQYYRAREDGGFRYHIVYHMKADSNALLKVYYRRSQLLASDNNSAASVDTAGIYNPRIVWEQPIALDTFIRQDGLMFGQSTNCGYPSLVVRDDPNLPPHMNPCVYVVYACQSPGPEDIAICEARLAANAATHAMQAQLYTTMRSSMLAYSKAYPSCPAEYADRLRNWGTPVVGATIGGNFYAWSDVRQGIIVGFKKPEATFFTNGTLQALKMHAEGSVVAQFPSLPSYTKMAIGEDDIPLVWQEGTIGRSIGEGSCTEGEHILYTRLFHNGDTVQHRLVASGTYPGILPPLQAQNNILRLTPLSTPVQTNYNRKPTIYRQMSEYDDAAMSLSNPLRSYGYVNHKADRIAWEHREQYNEIIGQDPAGVLPTNTTTPWQIDRLSIDCWDSCRSAAVPNRLWHSAISSVYYLDVDLRNPELVQGEQKTVLGTQVTSPQIASSWAYGDTSVVLSFNSEDHPGMGPRVYHMTFVDGYYRDQAVLVGTINNLGWAALDVTMRNAQGALQGERMPHVAARHSIVHSPSLLKNRRFSESALQLDVSAVYSNALYLPTPDIDRSTRGFFKETDDVFIPRDRIWRGYRSDQFDALLSDILIGGKYYSLLWDDTTTSARMHTAWFDAEDIVEIELKTLTQGASATMAQAKLERQSDREFIELPVLGVRGQMFGAGPSREPLQYQWTVLTDPNERYRLVLSTTDPEALPAEDVEMSAHKEPFARSSLSSGARQMGMIDGYTMRMIKDTIPAERIHVWPHPATDEVTLMCRTTATSTTPQLGAGGIVPLDIYNLAGVLVTTTTAHVASNGVISSHMAVSSLDEGFYTIVARSRYPMRGMMVVQR